MKPTNRLPLKRNNVIDLVPHAGFPRELGGEPVKIPHSFPIGPGWRSSKLRSAPLGNAGIYFIRITLRPFSVFQF
jgi:hypothetical protein